MFLGVNRTFSWLSEESASHSSPIRRMDLPSPAAQVFQFCESARKS